MLELGEDWRRLGTKDDPMWKRVHEAIAVEASVGGGGAG